MPHGSQIRPSTRRLMSYSLTMTDAEKDAVTTRMETTTTTTNTYTLKTERKEKPSDSEHIICNICSSKLMTSKSDIVYCLLIIINQSQSKPIPKQTVTDL